jgi:hypothetical protein
MRPAGHLDRQGGFVRSRGHHTDFSLAGFTGLGRIQRPVRRHGQRRREAPGLDGAGRPGLPGRVDADAAIEVVVADIEGAVRPFGYTQRLDAGAYLKSGVGVGRKHDDGGSQQQRGGG